jgi:hypothetical protein
MVCCFEASPPALYENCCSSLNATLPMYMPKQMFYLFHVGGLHHHGTTTHSGFLAAMKVVEDSYLVSDYQIRCLG